MLNCKKGKTKIDSEINGVLEEMEHMSSATDEYSTSAKNLETLYRARNLAKEREIDVNKVITAGAYLAGIAMILLFESYGGIITTKALSFIPKGRV